MADWKVDLPVDLKSFLSEKLGVSKAKAKDILDSRQVFVNGRRVWMAGHMLTRNDRVSYHGETERKPDIRIPVLRENALWLAVNKPAGILSNGGGSSCESVLRKERRLEEITAAHRLDRDTSGVLLFAKTPEVFDEFKSLWSTSSVEKEYLALAHGEAHFTEKTIDKKVEEKRAVSIVRNLGCSRGLTLFHIKLLTGRKHQIRLHLSFIRHPILGDPEHGFQELDGSGRYPVSRQMLHSARLSFPDLEEGTPVRIQAPLYADFLKVIKDSGLVLPEEWSR